MGLTDPIGEHGRRGSASARAVVGVVAALALATTLLWLLTAGERSDVVASASAADAVPVQSATTKPVQQSPVTASALVGVGPDPEAEPASALGWSVLVTDSATSAPIEGARISRPRSEMAASPEGGMPSFELLGETDSAGRFGPIQRPMESFQVAAEGYASQLNISVGSDAGGRAGPREIVVPLERSVPLRGRVIDAKGNGIADANVLLIASDLPDSIPKPGEVAPLAMSQTTTNPSGEFLFPDAPASAPVDLVARSEGFLPGGVDRHAPGAGPVTITLQRSTASIHGLVLTAEGQPVPKAVIRSRLVKGGNSAATSRYGEQIVVSDANGAYRIDGLGAGQYIVVAEVMRGDAAKAPTQRTFQHISIADGQDQKWDLTQPAVLTIHGRATDADTGAPVAGVRVIPYGTDAREELIAVSDASGDLVLRNWSVSDRVLRYRVEPPNGYAQIVSLDGTSNAMLVPNLSKPPKLEIKVRRAAELDVLVVAADGTTPIAGAVVAILRVSASERSKKSTTDQQGRAKLTVPVGEMVWVSAEVADLGSAGRDLAIAPGADPGEFKLVIKPWATVEGHVRDEAGKGVANVSVEAGIRRAGGRLTSAKSRAVTGDDGYYFLEKVQAGPVLMRVDLRYGADRALALRYTEPAVQPIELQGGESRRGVDFLLQGGLTLDGVVLDESGSPIPGAQIHSKIKGESPVLNVLKADASGRFSLPGLSEQTLVTVLQVGAVGYTMKDAAVDGLTVADSPITVVLEKHESQSIQIVYPDGSPVRNFAWRPLRRLDDGIQLLSGWRPVDSQDGLLRTVGTTGIFLEVFDTKLSESDSILSAVAEFSPDDFANGNTPKVVLGPSGSVRGRVLLEDGSPVADALILVNYPPPPGQGARLPTGVPGILTQSAVTDASGAFTLSPLAARTHSISVHHSKYQQIGDGTPVTIAAGREAGPVDIRMAGLGRIRGLVIGRDGKPAVGAIVSIRKDIGYESPTILASDQEGRFLFENALFQDYSIEVTITNPTAMTIRQSVAYDSASEFNEVVVDFSGVIKLTGRVLQRSKPYAGNLSLLIADESPDHSQGPLGSQPLMLTRGSAEYTILLRPGPHRLLARTHSGRPAETLPLTEFTIAPEPAEQTRNFELDLPTVTVALVFPTDADIVPGEVVLAPAKVEPVGLSDPAHKVRSTGADVRIPEVIAGTYIATFRSDDGAWQGNSEPVRISASVENIIAIDLLSPTSR